jgi:hypothetical protein
MTKTTTLVAILVVAHLNTQNKLLITETPQKTQMTTTTTLVAVIVVKHLTKLLVTET